MTQVDDVLKMSKKDIQAYLASPDAAQVRKLMVTNCSGFAKLPAGDLRAAVVKMIESVNCGTVAPVINKRKSPIAGESKPVAPPKIDLTPKQPKDRKKKTPAIVVEPVAVESSSSDADESSSGDDGTRVVAAITVRDDDGMPKMAVVLKKPVKMPPPVKRTRSKPVKELIQQYDAMTDDSK